MAEAGREQRRGALLARLSLADRGEVNKVYDPACGSGALLLDGLDDFFLLKPASLHRELEALVASRRGARARVPRAYSLFIQWLLTKGQAEVRVARDTLVTKLRLEAYRAQRKLKQAYKLVDEALEHALALGYLTGYEEDGLGVFTLRLNPQRCRRVKDGG